MIVFNKKDIEKLYLISKIYDEDMEFWIRNYQDQSNHFIEVLRKTQTESMETVMYIEFLK